MYCVQVAVHTDEDDAAALFLYRKLIKEPIEAPMFMPGPAVEATDSEMQVSLCPRRLTQQDVLSMRLSTSSTARRICIE